MIYTATAGYAGEDTFAYTIDDGKGGRSTATVVINVKIEYVAAQQQESDIPVGRDRHKKSGALDVFVLFALLCALAPRLPRRKIN